MLWREQLMEKLTCPKCGKPLHYFDGFVDPEVRFPDFVYCDNKECSKKDIGYDPASACSGNFKEVIHLR